MPSIFLSHSRKDKSFARKLADKLSLRGVNVWLDEAELKVGDSLIQKISEAIEKTDYVVAVLSHNSVSSPWVKKELAIAMTQEINGRKVKVLPLLLENCRIPAFLKDKLYADFSNPKNSDVAFSKLLDAIGVSKPTVTYVRQAAVRNHRKEKFEALRDAVLNPTLSMSPEESNKLIFQNLSNILTPEHLKILVFFNDPKEWGRKHGITYPNWHAGSPAHVLEHTFPELKGRRDFYDPIVKDLFAQELMSSQSLQGVMTLQGMFASRTTARGKQFIKYLIESNE